MSVIKSSIKRKKKKIILYDIQNGLCYYCNKKMFLSFNKRHEGLKNFATFEHLDNKNSPNRGKFSGQRRVVLACYSCNNNRRNINPYMYILQKRITRK